MTSRLAIQLARWLFLPLLILLGQITQTVQAQAVPPTYKGGLTMTRPVSPVRPWRLDVMGGRQFFGRLDIIQGRLRIPGSAVWGGSLSYGWRNNNRFTITYLNQPTELRLNPNNPFEGTLGDRRLTDLTVHYLLLGTLHEFQTASPVQPFAGVQAGMVIFDPVSSRYGSETKLAFGVTGGLRGPISGPLGWKAQAMFLMPILWTEGALFCGPGGCSIGIAGGSAIVQMNTNAGLTLSF